MAKCKKTISRKNLKKLAKNLALTAQELDRIAGGSFLQAVHDDLDRSVSVRLLQ